MATYDPVSTATSLAENYVYARQAQVDTGSSKAQAQAKALTSLKSSLTTFSSALNTLSGKGSVIAHTALLSHSTAAAATVSSDAAAGNYSFQVTQLASAQQTVYDFDKFSLAKFAAGTTPDAMSSQKTMVVSLGSSGFFAIDLSQADADGSGELSASEVARAINAANEGKISAAVMTVNGKQQLMLNSNETGVANAFEVHIADTAAYKSFIGNGSSTGKSLTELQTALGTNLKSQAPLKALAVAQDANFSVGTGAGLQITQSSNTYTGIEGLTLTFKEVTTAPVTVSVSKDESATKANMQGFVDAYNNLIKTIDQLSASGNAESGISAGALAGDAGIRSLRNQLNSLMRTQVDGVSLIDYGISAQRDGTIGLDGERFAKKVAANPEALNSLLGKTNSLDYKRSGVMGSLQSYAENWTKNNGGLLQTRQDGLQKQQTQYTKDQATIDRLYQQAYQRYLIQFTTLANLESSMANTSSMLSSMFASSSKSA